MLVSLFGGIILGVLLLNDFNIVSSAGQSISIFTSLLEQMWILKTLAFAMLVGSFMALLEVSGGIGGFVDFASNRLKLVSSKRSALMLSFTIGIVIFIESSITALISGAVGKPLCDKYKIPYAKLAFVCDSTSAPISSLIVLNGWGALLLGLITTQIGLGVIQGDGVSILIDSLFYNFYAIIILLITFLSIYFSIDIGAMKNAKYTHAKVNEVNIESKSMYLMLLPILLMIGSVFFFLYLTGNGDILKGSGSSSIFYTMLVTLTFTLFYYVGSKNMSLSLWSKTALKGALKLFPIASILLFAFAIGAVTTEMKTGYYLASLANENLSIYFLSAVIFLLSSIISFSTGTSWGTFSIMIPVAIPMAVGMDANISLAIGAVISGGIFGDHCSPISDTTIISSLASNCEVVEHVKTQLPYAIIAGIISILLFVIFSFI